MEGTIKTLMDKANTVVVVEPKPHKHGTIANRIVHHATPIKSEKKIVLCSKYKYFKMSATVF